MLISIKALYIERGDWTKITECAQEEEETVVQYFNRLKAIFDVLSGVPVPNTYVDNGPYAQQLKNVFLNGIKTPISGTDFCEN